MAQDVGCAVNKWRLADRGAGISIRDTQNNALRGANLDAANERCRPVMRLIVMETTRHNLVNSRFAYIEPVIQAANLETVESILKRESYIKPNPLLHRSHVVIDANDQFGARFQRFQ